MSSPVFLSRSPADTRAHAARLAAGIGAGAVLRLRGDLGAGKTTWLQGFVAALGATARVTSPTFALLHEYRDGRLPVFHWDLYRLGADTDWSLLDLPEQLPGDRGVTVIEWPDRYPGPWPEKNCRDITITVSGATRRRIEAPAP
ncbi:MAG: tRNA (adenosine(37)-N6)-threonylcarbamoyltransferase complex ATPase subunit type 1 TsaE [Verrucomicrobiales bacterium]|jgi:tRNA threonylcarbamoyladenosine biosynthesis protein TsaE|nr:tRNA (adenosine(37)-N6)-threonylcarbamoyltransferase complex ATPase subunit type 1 TsaE [Verrucomicrobiales bacterium]